MKERNTEITIFKSSNPEKLIVFYAESLEDQIRFYLNENHYISAIDCDNGNISIKYGEEIQEEKIKKSIFNTIKENKKKFIKLCFLVPILILLITIFTITLFSFFGKNKFIFLFVMFFVYYLLMILFLIIVELKQTSLVLRSKHSAEHMMVNFLEINKRLPRNMQEIKKSSRFSPNCGSKYMIEGIVKDFVTNILSSTTSIVVSSFVIYFYSNNTVEIIVFLGTYCLTLLILNILIKKYEKIGFIINPIQKILTNLVQCANTTKKVKDEDIMLAYSAAKYWIQIVYPEFYDQDKDIFEK